MGDLRTQGPFSHSDRIRYYGHRRPEAESAVNRLMRWLESHTIPKTLIGQYLPRIIQQWPVQPLLLTRGTVHGGAAATFHQLRGRRLLVVADEYIIASELAWTLQEHSAEIVGPAGSVADAQALIEAAAMRGTRPCSTSSSIAS